MIKKKNEILIKNKKIKMRQDSDTTWDEITDYLSYTSISSDEEHELLNLINHTCNNNNEYELSVKNLDDEQKFEIVRNLYNNLTFQELDKIEKMFKRNMIVM